MRYIVYVLLLMVMGWTAVVNAAGLELTGIETLSKGDRSIAVKAWPKLKQAFPGLDTYSEDLQLVSVGRSSSVKGVAFMIKVSDRPKRIPLAFKSNGNSCYIDVDSAVKHATLSKRACISVATEINAFDPALSASLKGGPLVVDLD